ncbi:unnamed protein product, partial [Callosobruchus maculatus]
MVHTRKGPHKEDEDPIITFLKKTHCHRDNIIEFQGFQEISRFSRSHHKGGGVGIWAHETLSVSKLEI